MAVLADLIRFTTATTGTGTLTVGSAVPPFMTPATYGAPFNSGTAVVFYSIIDVAGNNSETGTGTYTASGATLTRTPITSTNSNSAISLSGYAQVVFTAITNAIVNKSGDTMTGLLILSGDPATALGAVTKQYADAIAAGLNFKDSCVCATTANLTATYSNGVSGVGATLTNSGSQAAFSVDGQSPTVGQRVLVKNQSTTYQNGIYSVTVVGTGATNWVLTRTTDYDSVSIDGQSQINPGDLVPVENGMVNADSVWLQTATVVTIGTSAITFQSFIQPSLYALLTANTFTGTQTIQGSSSVLAALLTNAAEIATVSATAATGTIELYPSTQSVLYYTSNASANWTVDVKWSSGTTLDSALATGQCVTVAFLVTQGNPPYYNSAITIDGNASGAGGYTFTVYWQGGTAPTKGNASGIDVYTYTFIKTGTKTYTVFASQTQF